MTTSMRLRGWPDERGGEGGRPPSFGALLSDLRRATGLSQEELSERSGLSVRTIRNLETGQTQRPRRQTCELLASALGLSGAEARRLLSAGGGAELTGHPPGPGLPLRPSELPAATSVLVGRSHVLAEARQCLTGDATARETDRLVVVTGPPGAGKTSVVLHAAQQLRERFADGQVFVDLDGPHDRRPAEAVTARVLRALRVEQQPRSEEEQAALLRAVLTDRRVLVVVDNADSEAQIRPLLPCLSGSAVLVASRRRLWALPRGHAVELGTLSSEDSARLLERIVGGERVRAEPAAVRSIIQSCGRLPLALHIAGLWVAARPHRRLRELADRLADEELRMHYLSAGDLSLTLSVEAGFRRLPATARHALRRLSVLRGFFDVQDAAGVLGMDPVIAADVVDDLVHWQMLRLTRAAGDGTCRYQLYDFVRLHAVRYAGRGAA